MFKLINLICVVAKKRRKIAIINKDMHFLLMKNLGILNLISEK